MNSQFHVSRLEGSDINGGINVSCEDSIGRTGKHNPLCEGHVECPTTGREECGKVLNYMCVDGVWEPVTVFCFGCGKTHNVREKVEA